MWRWWTQNASQECCRIIRGGFHGQYVIAILKTDCYGDSLGSGAIQSRLQSQVRFTIVGKTFVVLPDVLGDGPSRSVASDWWQTCGVGSPTPVMTRLVDIPQAQRPWSAKFARAFVTELKDLFQFFPVLSTEETPVSSSEGGTLIAGSIRM
jgi:hypothetical protein